MKLSILVAMTAALAQQSSAHYIFSRLVQDGIESEDWQFIRETTRETIYMPTKYINTFDNLTPNDNDFRCNLGSFTNAANTDVANVTAGETLGMKLFYGGDIQHPGPAQVYMSKAPTGNVKEYEGDGEWFKIWERTLCDTTADLTTNAWCAWGMGQLEFQIPENTPAGEYLIRAEHVGLHGAQANEAEFFYSCAQVKVSGSGNGVPSITYKIPGIYNDTMKLWNGLNLWMDTADDIEADIADTPIGDEVWTGEAGSSTSAPSSISISATPVATSTPLTTRPAIATTAIGKHPHGQVHAYLHEKPHSCNSD